MLLLGCRRLVIVFEVYLMLRDASWAVEVIVE